MTIHRAVVSRNLSPPALPRAVLAARFAMLRTLEPGARVAAWARFLHARGGTRYVFGDDPTGYVAERRLIDDTHTDCLLFTMRVLELGQSATPEAAVDRAVLGRFPGVPIEEIAGADGSVNHAHPRRRRFAWELIQEGYYGTDVSTSLGTTVADPGTGQHPHGFPVVPKHTLDLTRLIDGDALWFVLDPEADRTRAIRAESGAMVGHVGIVVIDPDGEPRLIHAASKRLSGEYDGNSVVTVPVQTYIDRVETFYAVAITRVLSR